jgi:UDP:flavonoid glycosyltransferase YjiC (YdhE family)
MRIAYPCAGEGFGHAARMVALYGDLAARHSLDLFVPEPVEAFVRSRLPDAPIRKIPCFELKKRGNRILYGPTAFEAVERAARFPEEVRRISRQLKRRRVDVVLSDFEPYLPWAAKIAGLPVVQMNHPGIVGRFVDADPRSWIAAASSWLLEGPWDRRILVSFYAGDVGPVLRPSLLMRPVRDEGFLAVNLKDDARRRVLPILDSAAGLRYRLYPAPGADFDEGLATCSAVITTAGHQTLSEALALGKPVLALPQEGQFEQMLNARMLERTGRGAWCLSRDFAAALPRFLRRLGDYRSPRILGREFRLRDSRSVLLSRLTSPRCRALRP